MIPLDLGLSHSGKSLDPPGLSARREPYRSSTAQAPTPSVRIAPRRSLPAGRCPSGHDPAPPLADLLLHSTCWIPSLLCFCSAAACHQLPLRLQSIAGVGFRYNPVAIYRAPPAVACLLHPFLHPPDYIAPPISWLLYVCRNWIWTLLQTLPIFYQTK